MTKEKIRQLERIIARLEAWENRVNLDRGQEDEVLEAKDRLIRLFDQLEAPQEIP